MVTWKASENVVAIHLAWAEKYDGTHPLEGGGSPPNLYGEACAFTEAEDDLLHCGVDKGKLGGQRGSHQMEEQEIDFLFISKNPDFENWEVVGIYLGASTDIVSYYSGNKLIENWVRAKAPRNRTVELLGKQRIVLPSHKRPGRPMRLWLKRLGKDVSKYPELAGPLLAAYHQIVENRI